MDISRLYTLTVWLYTVTYGAGECHPAFAKWAKNPRMSHRVDLKSFQLPPSLENTQAQAQEKDTGSEPSSSAACLQTSSLDLIPSLQAAAVKFYRGSPGPGRGLPPRSWKGGSHCPGVLESRGQGVGGSCDASCAPGPPPLGTASSGPDTHCVKGAQ